jgi:hypothetical protein
LTACSGCASYGRSAGRSCSARFYRFEYSWAKYVVPLVVFLIAAVSIAGLAAFAAHRFHLAF